MKHIGNYHQQFFEKERDTIVQKWNAYSRQDIELPGKLAELIFPETFFSNVQYLIFPYFFRQVFHTTSARLLNLVSLAGFLYFKYLICTDSMLDKDVDLSQETAVPESILIARSHVYHQQSIRILSSVFPQSSPFWKIWKQRNNEFYQGVLLDQKYDAAMPYEVYRLLSVKKCAFLKATLDALYCSSHQPDKRKGLQRYNSLNKSFDHLAVGTCLQDDFEDFKKDLTHKKNNHGITLLQAWLTEHNISLDTGQPALMEKYFYASATAENLLEKSKEAFNLAIRAVDAFANELPEYIRYVEAFRNKANLLKVNIKAYRLSAQIKKLRQSEVQQVSNIPDAISRASHYIETMQTPDGSWFDVSNKQGLSNVWSTAFIAMHLPQTHSSFRQAARFLLKNRQNGLWGYNTDWVADYDSATCSLAVLQKGHYKLDGYLPAWWQGQQPSGGFSTYGSGNRNLVSYLGIGDDRLSNDWTSEHTCVSALAYYFLSASGNGEKHAGRFNALKNFLVNNIAAEGCWQPYWWTSAIYPTSFIVKGLLSENTPDGADLARTAINSILTKQQADGGYTCDILNTGSVFYSSMVLDMLCRDKSVYREHRDSAEATKEYILRKQFADGSFENTNFLIIPDYSSQKNQGYQSLKIDLAGGGGSITGEIAGLFTTSVAYQALDQYRLIKKQCSNA